MYGLLGHEIMRHGFHARDAEGAGEYGGLVL
jgi:hypothetical protein